MEAGVSDSAVRAGPPKVSFENGGAFLREIRSDPAIRHLRVVALTAFAMQGDRERALDAGFDDYITKPVTVGKLKAQLGLPAAEVSE